LPSLIEGDRNGINGDKFRYNANDPKLLERVEDVNTPLILSELTVLKEVAGVEKCYHKLTPGLTTIGERNNRSNKTKSDSPAR
jgi:hypothetical protein